MPRGEMKTASKLQRVRVSLSIVCSIAGYAYSDAPSWFGQMAKKSSLPSRS